jgi:hypothetical protein
MQLLSYILLLELLLIVSCSRLLFRLQAYCKPAVEPTPAVKTTQIVTKITELPVSLNNKIYHEKKMSTAK